MADDGGGVTIYHRVTERNSWEGETWYHYFEDDGEDRVLALLTQSVKLQNDLRRVDTVELTDDQATVLANLEPGYMDIHWFAELTDFDGLSSATSEDLYKGGIRKYGTEVFSYETEETNDD